MTAPEKQKTPAVDSCRGLLPESPKGNEVTATVAAPPATEEQIYAQDLTLGDAITRVRGTDIQVRWHVLSDPITCGHGHATVTVAMDGQWGNQQELTYPRDVYVTVASPARRTSARKAVA